MTSALVFQGKDIDAAVEKAVQELNLDKKELHIEVLDPGKDILFGLTRSKAVIKVSKLEEAAESVSPKDIDWEDWLKDEIQNNPAYNSRIPDSASDSHSNLQGKAWIKDGNLYFHDTETKKPVLEPVPGIEVVKNGETLKNKTALTQGDHIEFRLHTTRMETKWAIKVFEKKQQVELTVEPGYYLITFIEDHAPAEALKLKVNEKKQPDNQLTEKDIFDQLEKMKITTGIHFDRITTACSLSEAGTFIIAEGVLPKNGENGDLNFTIDVEEKNQHFLEKHDGTVDFRESNYIPSIEEGEMLGQIVDPTPGEDGISLYGEVLKAKEGQPVIVKTGKGVEYLEDDSKIIATEKGRPKIERTGQLIRISILPKMLHQGDLNLADGNIHFLGDVEITGNVNEQMVVDAEGSAFIHKSILHSSVQTRANITLGGNAISSQLIAGKNSLVFEEMAGKLRAFLDVLKPFNHVLGQLMASEQFKSSYKNANGLGPVVKVLTESKYKNLIPAAQDLLETINEKQNLLDKSWHTFAVGLYKGIILAHHNHFKEAEEINAFLKDGQDLLEICESPIGSHSEVQLKYSLNSTIHCNGDVHITGKGCVHSDIHADGKVSIAGRAMGGKIYGKKGVDLHQTGSTSGVKTVIEVPHDQEIRITEAMADTVIRVGDRGYIFKQDQSKIRARLDKDEKLVLY